MSLKTRSRFLKLLKELESNSLGQRRSIHEVPSTRPSTSDASKARGSLPERGAVVKDVPSRFAPSIPKMSLPSLTGSASRAPSALREAVGIQLSSFYRQHFNKMLAAGAVVSVYVLWRIMFNAAGFFINIENSIIEWQFILLSMAVVALSGVYLRARLNINPDAVYRKAMLRLNTNPAVLQRMGAPLVGSEVRATVTTGGNFKFGKRLLPKWQAKRTQMIFPLTGADRRGLVSVEAKKWKGTIVFKLLTVDVRDGRDESRVYLEGDSSVYNRGGVMRELRDPFLHALESEAQFAAEDEIDEAEEDRREDEEKARRRPKALEAGGGMFFYERIYYAIRSQIDHLRVRLGRA